MVRYADDTRGEKCLRSMLVIGNSVFCLLSCAVIAVGIYLTVEKVQFVSYTLGTEIIGASCYLIISAASIIFLISFIGCFATLFKNRTILLVYVVVLSLVFVVALMGSVLAIVYSAWVWNYVRVYMLEALLDVYGHHMDNDWNNLVTRGFDEAQEKWQCCAVDNNGWNAYRQSSWYKDHPGANQVDKPYVPASCCVRDADGQYANKYLCQMSIDRPPGLRHSQLHNDYLYYPGCLPVGKHILNQIAAYFIAIGFTFAAFVIGAVVCSLLLYRYHY